MPRLNLDLQKHTLNLYAGDMEELRALFPKTEPSTLIRELVRDCIVRIKSGDPQMPKLNLEVKL